MASQRVDDLTTGLAQFQVHESIAGDHDCETVYLQEHEINDFLAKYLRENPDSDVEHRFVKHEQADTDTDFTQQIQVRWLRPETPPEVPPIIIREEAPLPPIELPPLRIIQMPSKNAPSPPPLVIREAPPEFKQDVIDPKVIYVPPQRATASFMERLEQKGEQRLSDVLKEVKSEQHIRKSSSQTKNNLQPQRDLDWAAVEASVREHENQQLQKKVQQFNEQFSKQKNIAASNYSETVKTTTTSTQQSEEQRRHELFEQRKREELNRIQQYEEEQRRIKQQQHQQEEKLRQQQQQQQQNYQSHHFVQQQQPAQQTYHYEQYYQQYYQPPVVTSSTTSTQSSQFGNNINSFNQNTSSSNNSSSQYQQQQQQQLINSQQINSEAIRRNELEQQQIRKYYEEEQRRLRQQQQQQQQYQTSSHTAAHVLPVLQVEGSKHEPIRVHVTQAPAPQPKVQQNSSFTRLSDAGKSYDYQYYDYSTTTKSTQESNNLYQTAGSTLNKISSNNSLNRFLNVDDKNKAFKPYKSSSNTSLNSYKSTSNSNLNNYRIN